MRWFELWHFSLEPIYVTYIDVDTSAYCIFTTCESTNVEVIGSVFDVPACDIHAAVVGAFLL